jgi:hypothetical protein
MTLLVDGCLTVKGGGWKRWKLFRTFSFARGGETSYAVPDGGKRRASEYRQEFYRKLGLRVSVGGDIEISLDVGGTPVSKLDDSSCRIRLRRPVCPP